ncbi:MAG: MBOAT family protein [Clostridiales bacterium]|jgi:alginate O-acetyltransferase complex protein AlgI|nr:MBOAT family protein [Clostridiales bacterium]
MLFSSPIFLFAFLPIVLIGYYTVFRNCRNGFLLFMSVLFYAYGEPKFVFVMLASIGANWAFALAIGYLRERKPQYAKLMLWLMVAANCTLFFVFKYLNFAVSQIDRLFADLLPHTSFVLPIGISFFTFQAMSYVIDVYRGRVPARKNPLDIALYISLFPQLIAGPIVRYETVAGEIDQRKVTIDDFSDGITRFVIGLGKKLLIANSMATIADTMFDASQSGTELGAFAAWLGAVAYSFQILFDFSGYSDMAIGLGKMLGFHFLENFNYPYIATTVTEFWRRWHISLGTWFRDYVYFPLGGSRVSSSKRLVINLLVVWTLTGIWHGASWNFIGWGLMYFIVLTFEKVLEIPQKLANAKNRLLPQLYRMFTLLVVLGEWVLFRALGVRNAVRYGLELFNFTGGTQGSYALWMLKENWMIFVLAILCSTPLFKKLFFETKITLVRAARYIAVLLILIVCASWAVSGTYDPFIYFNF